MLPLLRRNGDWCSGRFYHLKEVCWSDPTTMFQRYKPLINGLDISFQEPRALAPFYKPLEHMSDFFLKVRCTFTVFLRKSFVSIFVTLLLCLLRP